MTPNMDATNLNRVPYGSTASILFPFMLCVNIGKKLDHVWTPQSDGINRAPTIRELPLYFIR
jgi:hypothetical protein